MKQYLYLSIFALAVVTFTKNSVNDIKGSQEITLNKIALADVGDNGEAIDDREDWERNVLFEHYDYTGDRDYDEETEMYSFHYDCLDGGDICQSGND